MSIIRHASVPSDESQIIYVIDRAENELKACWSRLLTLQSEDSAEQVAADAFISFQPALLSALFDLESLYKQICQSERQWVSQEKTIPRQQFSEQRKTFKRHKKLINGIIDVGRSLGDAFAWIFYKRASELLRKHYEHEVVARIPTGVGGTGELQFLRNHPKFGRYFVLAHSITTFLREGDVSLIDPNNLKVAAIGEIKTRRTSETELTARIVLVVGTAINEDMLPAVSKNQQLDSTQHQALAPEIADRLERQVKRIQEMFRRPTPNVVQESPAMISACSKLDELFVGSSANAFGKAKIGKGLYLFGVKSEYSSFASQVIEKTPVRGTDYANNLKQVPLAAQEIIDNSLPDNSVILDSMPYHAQERYELGLWMRPLFWWPLSPEAREALIFKRMIVITLYNHAFLLNDLRRMGLEVRCSKDDGIQISKKYGDGRLKLTGVNHVYKMIQAHLFSEESVAGLIKRMVEAVENANLKQSTDVDFDFMFQ